MYILSEGLSMLFTKSVFKLYSDIEMTIRDDIEKKNFFFMVIRFFFVS